MSDDNFQESLKENSASLLKDNRIANLFGIKPKNSLEIKDFTENSDLSKLPEADDTIIKIPLKPQEESVLKELEFLESISNVSSTTLRPENPLQNSVSQMNNDDNGITHNLLEKPKVSATNEAKKSLLMEDLFGSKPLPNSSADTSRRKNVFNIDVPATNLNSEPSMGLVNQKTNKTSMKTGFSLSPKKELRRGRKSPVDYDDPLGLFSSSIKVTGIPKSEEKIPVFEEKSPAIENVPEWLGGPQISKEQKEEIDKVKSEDSSIVKSAKISGKISGSINLPVSDETNLASKLLSMKFNQQAAIINMQQQEYELRTAAVLSQQNENLNYLLEAQKSKLVEQEKQFNMLITRQLERQALVEAQMKAQQDRIDSYINTLTAEPSTDPSIHLSINKNITEDSKETKNKGVELENILQNVQLEKMFIENTVESLREKHEREICILEDSYKKQIQFLEESIVKMEKRLQDNVECLETDYKLKIEKLKQEATENKRIHKAELETVKEENLQLIDNIQNRHSKSLQILQEEETKIIERIIKSKESEFQAMELMRMDRTNIENLLNKSQIIIESLEVLHKKFESTNTYFIESQDNHLIMQEKNIEHLKAFLDKEQALSVEEKQKLIAAAEKLEVNSNELVQQFQKQNINFKENEEILKSRERSLLRDREMFIEQTNWEYERLQAMRDMWLKEEEKQLQWLTQERQALFNERRKLQIFNRIKNEENASLKMELEATIKAAQAATSSANKERLKWQEKIKELEIQENIFKEKENQLIIKAKELQDFTQSALAKKEEGLKALKDARFLEESYKEKVNQLQIQKNNLTQRENKLALEKVELSRERLSLRLSVAEKPEEVTINKIDPIRHKEKPILAKTVSNIQHITYLKDTIDPHLLLLKWDLDNEV